MKTIKAEDISKAVKNLLIEANYTLPQDICGSLEKSRENETWPMARDLLGDILDNIDASREEKLPLCQDTGMACVFIELGQDLRITGGSLYEAVNEGVRQGFSQGLLRASVVADPIRRKNTGDNTPASIVCDIADGDKLKLTVAPKGFGSENMSRIKMLAPSDGIEGAADFVLETVLLAGGNPCPPIVVGVGIGGTFEKAALLAKRALLRPVTQRNPDIFYAQLEEGLLQRINETGIGPQGFGGKTTALGVNVEVFPTHIAGLPVAVNMGCHVTRHASAVLEGENEP